MSYNGSGTFVVNSAGQPVVTGTVISSTAFNALTADLATGLSTAITKDGQTTTTVRVPFAQGISSTLVTDATSATTGSIITAGGISTQKALWVGTTSRLVGNVQADGLVGIGVTPTSGVGTVQALVDSNQIGFAAYRASSVATTGLYSSVVALQNASSTVVPYAGIGGSIATNTAGSHTGNLIFAVAKAGAITEVSRIDANGNMLVNLTSSMNGNAKFQVTGSDTTYTTVINDGTATTNCQLIRFNTAGAGIGTVTNAANVAVAYNTTSDKNLKTFVGPRDNGNLFDLVEWNEFIWNKAPQIGVQVGVFAQDIQKLIPNVVAEGRGVFGDEDYEAWQVNYTGLVPYLGAEVKSLRARVASLEARLTALENK